MTFPRSPFLVLPLALLGTGLPAVGQSFEEAVRHNLAAAVEYCVRGGPGMQAWIDSFVAAGFGYSRRGDPGVEVYHRFQAPADTVSAEIYDGQMAPDCRVETAHLGVTEAIPLVGEMLARHFPGRFERGGIGPQTPCTGYIDRSRALPETITFTNASPEAACVEDGTTQIFVSSGP
jgi:hypothetical protein